jgi:hypothetical protein
VSLKVGRHLGRRTGRAYCTISWALLFWVPLVLLLSHLSGAAAPAAQTKEQCEKCCEGLGHDEYYLDQCKLKCFRTPDHCADQKSQKEPPAQPQTRSRPAAPPPEASQPSPPATTAPEPSQPREQGIVFRWPETLNLSPGREAEAAAIIVQGNGISPQNPNYSKAVSGIAAALIDFARKNPQGGNIPTSRLARIIMRYR